MARTRTFATSAPRHPWVAAVAALLIALAAAPGAAHAGSGTIAGVTVSGSPFSPNGDGVRERARFNVRLARTAELTVVVLDFDGAVMRTLLGGADRARGWHSFSWNGRNSQGRRVADGPYVFRAVAQTALGQSTAEALVTKARMVIYPARPGAIVVAVDPGHGDVYSEPGRYAPDGTHESEINLDIGLRLQAMLLGAGVNVVITRTTQVGANMPEWDRNGDGLIDYYDELAARPDTANLGRADAFISIHNNLATNTRVGGPSVYYRQDRPFSAQSLHLAQRVYANMLARLDLYRTDTWKPSRAHGILSHQNYYVLSAYSPPRVVRPSLMPGVLSEGLFLTHPYELSLLKRADVRQSMATAYYDAIVEFVAARPHAARYVPLLDPGSVPAGEPLTYGVRIVNKGMQAASGWRLEARLVPAVPLYDGSGARGELLGSAVVPRLGRGQRADVSVNLTAPGPGDWLVKFDVVMPDGTYLSDRGVVALQLPLGVGGGSAASP